MSESNNGGNQGTSGAASATAAVWKKRLRKGGKWVLGGGLALVLLCVLAFVILYKTIDIPEPNSDYLTETSHVYWKDGKHELGTFRTQNRTSLPYAKMPQNIKDAVVAAENRTFWTDKGIDPKGILRAAFSNATSSNTQGASTITQQYVKILYLTQERSYTRKVKEAILSLKIHNQLSKQEILEGYLNTIYFGRGAYGIEAASQAYFGIPAKKLNLRQAAALASVLNNPYGDDPANGKDARHNLKERYEYTLHGMESMGTAPAGKVAKAEKHLPKFPKIPSDNRLGGQNGHMLQLVKDQLQQLTDKHGNKLFTPQEIDGGGLKITTTLSKKAMNAAEQGVKEEEPSGLSDKNLHVGVASVEPGTGALRGFYGGQDYLKSQIDWAATGGMAGSTMKPFTATAALEAGFELKDTFDGNSPYTYPNGEQVVNEGESSGMPTGMSYGRVDMIKAMEESINTAFIDMTVGIPDGPRKIWQAAVKAGLPPMKGSKEHPGIPSTTGDLDPTDSRITLGKATVSPINMADAYATIAARGEHNDVFVIQKVEDRNGAVLYQHKDNPRRAMPRDIADDASYLLQNTADAGTGSANASSSDLGRPDAGKTGTATKESADGGSYVSSAWFSGFTPQLATAVMYVRGDGNDRLDGWMPSYFGADYPAATYAEVMRRALEGAPVQSFPPPAWHEGTAPTSGHEPAPPPAPATHAPPAPKPTKQAPAPKPTKSSKPKPTNTPSSLPTSTQSAAPPGPPTASSSAPAQPSQQPGGGGPHGGGPPGKKRAAPAWAYVTPTRASADSVSAQTAVDEFFAAFRRWLS